MSYECKVGVVWVSRSQVISDLNIPKTHLSSCVKHVCRRLQVRLGITIMTGPDIGRYCARGGTHCRRNRLRRVRNSTVVIVAPAEPEILWGSMEAAPTKSPVRHLAHRSHVIPSGLNVCPGLRCASFLLFFWNVSLNVMNTQNTWLHLFLHWGIIPRLPFFLSQWKPTHQWYRMQSSGKCCNKRGQGGSRPSRLGGCEVEI